MTWGYHANDDKSPLIGLLNCIVCKETMMLEKSAPDAEGKDIIQRVRLFRRSRDAAGAQRLAEEALKAKGK